MSPQRIQRRRTKGWRMPEGAVYVGRGSKWGNPCRVVPQRRNGPFDLERDGVGFIGQSTGIESARASAARRYRDYVQSGIVPPEVEIRAELAGKDLACWCPLDQPCHADVLLELANREEPCTCFSIDPATWEVRFGECTDPNYFRPDPGCPTHGCPMTPDKEA